VRRQKPKAGDKIRADAEVRIRLGLDDATNCAQGLEFGEMVEVTLDRSTSFQRKSDDHPCEPGVALGLLADPCRLLEVLIVVDVDLDKHELIDADRRGSLCQMLRKYQPIQLGRAAHPRVAKPLRIAQMHVTVDDRKVQHPVLLLTYPM
jgi:hypothetical protein